MSKSLADKIAEAMKNWAISMGATHYINGSGKHDNWSMSTLEGENLFDAGKNVKENYQFLLFLSAIITATECKKDNTDRNRTSPFAFTGNKFEFRMLGSECNISCPTTMINTAVAEALKKETDIEEKSRKYHDEVLNAMTELRKPIDELEKLVSKKTLACSRLL